MEWSEGRAEEWGDKDKKRSEVEVEMALEGENKTLCSEFPPILISRCDCIRCDVTHLRLTVFHEYFPSPPSHFFNADMEKEKTHTFRSETKGHK